MFRLKYVCYQNAPSSLAKPRPLGGLGWVGVGWGWVEGGGGREACGAGR